MRKHLDIKAAGTETFNCIMGKISCSLSLWKSRMALKEHISLLLRVALHFLRPSVSNSPFPLPHSNDFLSSSTNLYEEG